MEAATLLSEMSANQQFIIALVTVLVAPVASIAALFVAHRTHKAVNSRIDEYKLALVEASKIATKDSLDEFKRLLAIEAAAIASKQTVLPTISDNT